MALDVRRRKASRRSELRPLLWFCFVMATFSSAWAQDRPQDASKADPPAQQEPVQPAAENAVEKAADRPAKDAAKTPAAHLIHVEVPIVGDIDTKVKRAVSRILADIKPGQKRPILVLELDPGQTDGGKGSDFSRSMALARYLAGRDLAGVQVVGYVPKTIKGHAVLVAMACEEIVMAADAEIGDAGCDEDVIGPTMRSVYKEVADARGTIPAAVALAMLDGKLQALRVTTEKGTEYILDDQLEELKKRSVVQNVEPLKPKPLLLDGSTARELNFVNYLAADRASLARALKLQPESLQDDSSIAGGWRPVQAKVNGAVTGERVRIIQKQIENQVSQNDVNFIVVWIDSDGGSFASSIELANQLAALDSSKIKTVAYIDTQARADAALIALACDQIVMRPGAIIGGAGSAEPDANEVKAAIIPLRELVKKTKSRHWSLPAAMIDKSLKVYKYTQPSTGLVAYFCDEELKEQPDPDSWKQGELVSQPSALALSGKNAEELGIAWKLVDDFAAFKQAFGLQGNVTLVEPGWADYLIQLLAREEVKMFLLVIGFAGIYLEVHTPGIGLGSFVALVAFLLFFWAQYMQGTANALEIMLFVVGVLCVAVEILVLPGVGIFGLGGGILIIASLILASQTFVIPGNAYQLAQMRNSMLVLGGSVVGIVGIAIAARRFIPHTPGLNRMLLAPPSGEELEALSLRESLVDFRHLEGKQGIATTRLVLSGKAKIGNELVDVIADGEPIDRGAPIEVVEVTGSRVVVREVREEGQGSRI
jgi:membrane-bound serine protease (ClpP class)